MEKERNTCRKEENDMNHKSSNKNKTNKELTDNEKFEINLGLSQLNRGERISLEIFLKKVTVKPDEDKEDYET